MKQANLQVNLRVAGGWVRDKLLRIDCKDVDIALDTMMGEAFAGYLCEYLRKHDLAPRGVGLIHSNPDRSKHLETATIIMLGQPIDFVNLRAEEYASGSRIPEKIQFGSPLEDALRRDITINSLFYHIQDETIEDWSGYGLLDLEEGIIRTPLAPETTLMDDPLRLLRIIRFASRYGYALTPEIIEAALKSTVHAAFLTKVSRERVGIEFDKTISDPNGFNGLRLYARLNAFPLLVMDETEHDWPALLEIFKDTVMPFLTKETRRLALLGFPFIPFNDEADRLNKMLREALKLPNRDVQDVIKVMNNARKFTELAKKQTASAVEIGRLIRSAGENWRLAIFLACAQHVWNTQSFALEESLVLHKELIQRAESLRLDQAWQFTHLLSVLYLL